MEAPIDLSAFLPDFLAEIQEHLDALTRGLLELERQPDDAQLVRALFRSAHTIKGTARMIGYAAIAEVAHALEDTLDDLRERRMQAEPIVIDALLQAVDAINKLLAAGTRQPTDSDERPPAGPSPTTPSAEGKVAEVLRRLESIRNSDRQPVTSEREATGRELPPAHRPLPTDVEPSPADDTIRVSVARLDGLLKQIGDLAALQVESETSLLDLRTLTMMAREQRQAVSAALASATALPASPASARLIAELTSLRNRTDRLLSRLNTAGYMAADHLERLAGVTDRLHEDVTSLRLLPLATIFAPLSRTVRDLAREQGKQIELTLEGGEVELDRYILQEVNEPLLHLVRNAVSHGIELPENRVQQGKPPAGHISLRASRRGDRAILAISDDGRGMDPQVMRQVAVGRGIISAAEASTLDDQAALELIYAPGFSTSPFITETSGRGVGMGVVKTVITGLGGAVTLSSRPGSGSTFTLSLPLTLSLIHVLLISAGNRTYALPAVAAQAVRLNNGQGPLPYLPSPNGEVGSGRMDIEGQTIPVVSLADALGLASEPDDQPSGWRNAILLRSGESQVAFAVEAFLDERRVIVKPVTGLLRRVPLISGATILADGAIAFLLDPTGLVRAVCSHGSPLRTHREAGSPSALSAVRKRILVVDDVTTTRELQRSILAAAGYEVEGVADGAAALARLNEAHFDLVLTDIEMPVMDGFALTAAIRSQPNLAHLPVIIVTSLANDRDRRRGLEVGAQAYIVKSAFNQAVLLDTIARLV